MFEKSLYDLIKGLRNHKGTEKEYTQKSLKECRAEVRSQDMDLKATALLKLVYLEMMGHDMSWASFHVLEVMSSPKYHQKRVGYLGAVQTFRPDTEVLMLATNLLKKDLASPTPTVISLPIATLPHLITPSLALSTLADLLPRMNHSHANIRKKTLVTLYRLALVYPEALRAAWPKIKERLMDPDEDASVTAAIVNVVCELGWRRPHDFLPLAPRLFELLVDGGNNWMAIKLIKLFATLTPMEPRLVKKLLPPLTNIIKTTPAMSLLYECINGIIQGGILGSDDDSGTEEIATLCVNKLRGMIMVDGDPNLKYVALLAFNKIVVTHPYLVSQQEDVILDCIDSPDITIRIQVLDLVQGMVTSENLMTIVSRLMKQLKHSTPPRGRVQTDIKSNEGLIDSDDETQDVIQDSDQPGKLAPPLPEDYRMDIAARILSMCAKDDYDNIVDFDWYIDVLTQLVRMAPTAATTDSEGRVSGAPRSSLDISERIGDDLRSVAVKVRAMRATSVRAAEVILAQVLLDTPAGHSVFTSALKSIAWILGEYAAQLAVPDDVLNSLLQLIPRASKPEVTTTAMHALVKVFAFIAGNDREPWTAERKSKISLLMARILHVLEPHALHPNLEVQERAVEFIELFRLTSEAVSSQAISTDDAYQGPPLLLSQAIPSLFTGWELNSVSLGAQSNVPLPVGINLDEAIHPNLDYLLSQTEAVVIELDETEEFEIYYHQRPAPTSISSSSAPAINRLADPEADYAGSYQHAAEDSYLDADIVARRKADRIEKNKDDPFYIPGHGRSRADESIPQSLTPIHNILQSSNGPDLDIDSIPIMQLDLDKVMSTSIPPSRPYPQPRQKVIITADETLGDGKDKMDLRLYDSENNSDSFTKTRAKKLRQGLLQVDSSYISSFSLENNTAGQAFDHGNLQQEEAEMRQAMKEVERLRLEMQRANERIHVAQGVDVEGTVIKRKKKKPARTTEDTGPDVTGAGEQVGEIKSKAKKKKKKVPTPESELGTGPNQSIDLTANDGGELVAPKKKKKKKKPAETELMDALPEQTSPS